MLRSKDFRLKRGSHPSGQAWRGDRMTGPFVIFHAYYSLLVVILMSHIYRLFRYLRMSEKLSAASDSTAAVNCPPCSYSNVEQAIAAEVFQTISLGNNRRAAMCFDACGSQTYSDSRQCSSDRYPCRSGNICKDCIQIHPSTSCSSVKLDVLLKPREMSRTSTSGPTVSV